MIYLNIHSNKFNDISSRLQQQEDVLNIEEMSFLRKGLALWVIREQELYLSGPYANFNEYVINRWGMTRRRADYLIQAARIMETLTENFCSHKLPTKEAHVRPLAKLECSGQMIEAWEKVLEQAQKYDQKITGTLVINIVQTILEKEQPTKNKISLSNNQVQIIKALKTLEKFNPGEIRELILSPHGSKLGLANTVEELRQTMDIGETAA